MDERHMRQKVESGGIEGQEHCDTADQRPTEQEQTDAARERSMSSDSDHGASASDEANGLWSETHKGVQPDLHSESITNVTEDSLGTPVTGSYSSSLLDDVADFINDHLRAFRAIPWVLGGAGALLVIRYTHMFTRFRHVKDIPQRLFTQNSQLSGIAATTDWNTIGFWHVPIGGRMLRWKHRPPTPCPSNDLLTVEFAGVAIGNREGSEQWLGTHLRGRRVWCTLLHRSSSDGAAAVVYARKKGFLRTKFSVNRELLAQGLGSIDKVNGFHTTEDHTQFVLGLQKVEQVAKRKGVGVWEGGEYEGWWRKVGRTLRRLFTRGRRLFTRGRRRDDSDDT